MRQRCNVTVLAAVPLLFFVEHSAEAGLDEIMSEISSLESEVENLEKTYLEAEEALISTQVEKRVADGELYFRLQDYQRAAIVFLDIVDRYPGHPAYPNALFMLAESMFHSSDYYGARTRYIELLDHRQEQGFSRYVTPALSRLLEISMHIEEFAGAEKYFEQLDSMSGGKVESITKYVKGKYYYFKEEFDRALQTFQGIKEGEEYHPQAQFFIGVIYTRKQDFQGAISIFKGLAKMKAQTPQERRILNLARLNYGRLLYQTEQLEMAAEAYEAVPPTSDLYDTALYEVAMVYIKMGDPTRAERSLEVLSISNPESGMIPNAKILRGNLLLRVGRFDEAYSLFKEIGKQFKPVKDELDEVIAKHPDPEEYFHEIIRTNLETFDAKSFLPPLAIAWMRKSPLTERGIQTLGEIAICKDVLDDNEKLIEKMRFVLEGPGRINAFPMLKAGKSRAIQIENRITKLLEKLAAYQEDLLSEAGRTEFKKLQQEMEEIEGLVKNLPTSPEEYAVREREAKESYRKLAQAMALLEARVDRLQAKIVATELYIEGVIKAKTGVVPADIEAVRTEIETQKEAVKEYRVEIEKIGRMISLAKTSVGVGDENDMNDANVRAAFQALIKKEMNFLESKGVSSATTGKIAGALGRIEGIRKKLASFNAIVETLAMRKSQEILAEIGREAGEMRSHEEEVESITSEAEDVVGLLALAKFAEIKKSFDDLIVKADVGVIDVAWSRKEEHRSRAQYLTSDRLEKLTFLEDEFKEVFEDEETEKKAPEGEE